MTKEENIDWLCRLRADLNNGVIYTPWNKEFTEALNNILEQEPCGDAISRQAVLELVADYDLSMGQVVKGIHALPPVNPQDPKTGHCKDCKYFEYDSVVKADGIPLIVAHEICSKWGDGCKTSEDGYCFLFEPQEVRNKE